MNILGIDFGKKKIGISLGNIYSKFAEPYEVLRYDEMGQVVKRIGYIADKERIDTFVVGVSEGKSAQEAKSFGKELEDKLKVTVKFQDETLTTFEAQLASIQAGIKRSRRRGMEDAYAATLILQNYLDTL